MTRKHTQGPWKTWPSIHNGQTYIVKGDYTIKDNGCIAHADTEANALLIAAAPELLDAAEMAFCLLDNFVEDPRVDVEIKATMAELKKAINKAKGE